MVILPPPAFRRRPAEGRTPRERRGAERSSGDLIGPVRVSWPFEHPHPRFEPRNQDIATPVAAPATAVTSYELEIYFVGVPGGGAGATSSRRIGVRADLLVESSALGFWSRLNT